MVAMAARKRTSKSWAAAGSLASGGLDGALGDGAGVAEVDEGGEGVVAGGAVVGGGCGGRGGHVVELVFEFEDDALGGLFADAGDAGEGGVVGGADGGDEAVGVDAAEHGDGELGADAGDGEEFLEEALLLRLGEAEEGDLVLADVGVDVQAGLGAFGRERGEGGDADGGVVADAGALDDGLVGRFGEQAAAEESDHSADCTWGGAGTRAGSRRRGGPEGTAIVTRLKRSVDSPFMVCLLNCSHTGIGLSRGDEVTASAEGLSFISD